MKGGLNLSTVEHLTGEDENQEADKSRVAHIEHRTRQATEADSRSPESECIQEHIATGHARAEERSPLPAVILGAK